MNGNYEGTIQPPVKGESPDAFKPAGLAVDRQDNLYITDNNNLIKYTPKGVATISQLKAPNDFIQYIFRDITLDAAGNMYVTGAVHTDEDTPFILKVAPDGTILRRWSRPTGNHLRGLAVDSKGNVYVNEGLRDKGYTQLEKFSPDGKLLQSWRASTC